MRKEVIIVESDRRSADALVLRLTARGYGVASAASLGEAEQAVTARRPDLVILGLGLPGSERLIRRVRALGGATLPVLLVGTGAEGIATTAEAVAAGADDFFRKPGELDLVVEKVAVLLGPGRTPGEPASMDETVDFSSLNELAWSSPPRRVPPAGRSEPRLPAPDAADFSALNEALADPDSGRRTPVAGPSVAVPTPGRLDVTTDSAWPALTPTRIPTEPLALDDLPDWDDSVDLEGPEVAEIKAVLSTDPPRPPLPAGLRSMPQPSTPPVPPISGSQRPLPAPRPLPASLPAQPFDPPRLSGNRPAEGRPVERGPVERGPVERRPVESRPVEAWPAEGRLEALPTDRPGRGFQAPEAPVPEEEAEWQARLQPGRSLPLSERPLGVALAAAARLALTGRLEVAAGGVLRRVFLDEGRPVFFDSSDPEEDLAGTLATEGLVTRAAVARARVRGRPTGATADEVLIEQGFVPADAAYRALRTHVIERVVALFALEGGDALVVQGGPRPPDPVDLGQPPGRLIMDAIRRRYGRLRLYQAYGTPVSVPRVRRHPGELLPLRADEEAVLRACDGRRTAAEIARGLRLGEVDVLAMLYGLAVMGSLEAPLGAGAGTLPPLPGQLLVRAGAPRSPDELPGYGDLVARKLADVQTADYFAILEVPRGATGAELEAAWETLRRRFDPQRMRSDGPLFGAVAEIAAVLDDARALLTDARLRLRYEAALGD